MKRIVQKDEVRKAMEKLRGEGTPQSASNIHRALGGVGSLSTVVKFRDEILNEAAPAPKADAQLESAFRSVWAAAVEAGRKERGGELALIEADLAGFQTENERLTGELSLLETRVVDLDRSRENALAELTRAREEAAAARAASAHHAEKLVSSQTRVTDLLEELNGVRSKNDQALSAEREARHAAEIEVATLRAKLEQLEKRPGAR